MDLVGRLYYDSSFAGAVKLALGSHLPVVAAKITAIKADKDIEKYEKLAKENESRERIQYRPSPRKSESSPRKAIEPARSVDHSPPPKRIRQNTDEYESFQDDYGDAGYEEPEKVKPVSKKSVDAGYKPKITPKPSVNPFSIKKQIVAVPESPKDVFSAIRKVAESGDVKKRVFSGNPVASSSTAKKAKIKDNPITSFFGGKALSNKPVVEKESEAVSSAIVSNDAPPNQAQMNDDPLALALFGDEKVADVKPLDNMETPNVDTDVVMEEEEIEDQENLARRRAEKGKAIDWGDEVVEKSSLSTTLEAFKFRLPMKK